MYPGSLAALVFIDTQQAYEVVILTTEQKRGSPSAQSLAWLESLLTEAIKAYPTLLSPAPY